MPEQVVILAAGRSSRFWPLNKEHKSLIKILGKPLILHTIEALAKKGLKDIIVVQGPERDIEIALKEYSLSSKVKLSFVVADKPAGTGYALLKAASLIKKDFFLLGGHKVDIGEHISKLSKKFKNKGIVFLGSKTDRPWDFGVLDIRSGKIAGLVENPEKGREPSNVKTNEIYLLKKSFLDYLRKIPQSEDSLIKAFNLFIKDRGADFVLAEGKGTSLKYPWDLFGINEYLLSRVRARIKRRMKENCKVSGPLIIEKDSLLKSGTYIEGPVYIGKNCQIGPNCYIRAFTSIGDNCRVGNGVEIKNSIIGDNSRIPHLSYIGDSIIGRNCNFGAGVIIANLRFDGKEIKSKVKGEWINTGRQKFGSVIGDNTQLGINASLMPGVLIGSRVNIGPNSLVKENIEDNSIFYNEFPGIAKSRS